MITIEASAASMPAFCDFKATAQDIRIVRDTESPDLDLATLAGEYAGIQLHDMKHMGARKLVNYCSIFVRKPMNPEEVLYSTVKLHHYSARQNGNYIG